MRVHVHTCVYWSSISIILSTSHGKPRKLIIQMKKLQHREVKCIPQAISDGMRSTQLPESTDRVLPVPSALGTGPSYGMRSQILLQ